jgi:uncharacterized protein (TIGR03083 family)
VVYRHVRSNLVYVLASRPDAARLSVPACPGWTVYDTVAHLVAACHLAERNLLGGRRGRARGTLPELLAEWERSGARVEQGLRDSSSSRAGSVLVMDAYTHEYDIRYAVRSRLPAEHPAFRTAFDLAVGGFGLSVTLLGRPALRLETASSAWDVGDGDPAAVVFGTEHDLYRSLVGRRTLQQIRELAWTADPTTWLPAFTWGPFRPPLTAVE